MKIVGISSHRSEVHDSFSVLMKDGKSRRKVCPHLVTKKANPLYHSVIKEFEKLTGVGTILNTSFNRHGLPIIYSPKDAVEHLLWEAIDTLVIGNYVVERNKK